MNKINFFLSFAEPRPPTRDLIDEEGNVVTRKNKYGEDVPVQIPVLTDGLSRFDVEEPADTSLIEMLQAEKPVRKEKRPHPALRDFSTNGNYLDRPQQLLDPTSPIKAKVRDPSKSPLDNVRSRLAAQAAAAGPQAPSAPAAPEATADHGDFREYLEQERLEGLYTDIRTRAARMTRQEQFDMSSDEGKARFRDISSQAREEAIDEYMASHNIPAAYRQQVFAQLGTVHQSHLSRKRPASQ